MLRGAQPGSGAQMTRTCRHARGWPAGTTPGPGLGIANRRTVSNGRGRGKASPGLSTLVPVHVRAYAGGGRGVSTSAGRRLHARGRSDEFRSRRSRPGLSRLRRVRRRQPVDHRLVHVHLPEPRAHGGGVRARDRGLLPLLAPLEPDQQVPVRRAGAHGGRRVGAGHGLGHGGDQHARCSHCARPATRSSPAARSTAAPTRCSRTCCRASASPRASWTSATSRPCVPRSRPAHASSTPSRSATRCSR